MIVKLILVAIVLAVGYVYIGDAYEQLQRDAWMAGVSPSFAAMPWVVIIGTALLIIFIFLDLKTGFFGSVKKSLDERHRLLSESDKLKTLSQARWIHVAVWMLVALSVVLTLVWAWKAPEDNLVRWFFCLGFVGMVILRDRILPAAVNAWQQGQGFLLGLTIIVSLVTTTSLLGTSLFELVNESGNGAQQRLTLSAPAIALKNDIERTREQLLGLAEFADASKAHQETESHNHALASAQAKTNEINAKLAALSPPVFPSRFARFMSSDCSPKTDASGLSYRTKAKELCAEWQAMSASYQQQKRVLEAQLPSSLISSTAYADNHHRYIGLQKHLSSQEEKLANFSSTGMGVKEQWKSEDRMLAKLFNIEPETASWVKWVSWAFIFDLVAVIGLIIAQMLRNIAGGDKRAENRRIMRGLDLLGVDVSDYIQGALNNAFQVNPSVPHASTAPQLRDGGWILTDGLVHGHEREAVLNKGAAQELEQKQPGLIDKLNAKHRQPVLNPDAKRVEISGKRGKGRIGLIDNCLHCGSDYTVGTWTQVYCCKDCAAKASGYASDGERREAYHKGHKR